MADDSVYDQLAAMFKDVQATCTKETKKSLKKHANRLKNRIKNDSPKRTGGYAKGWVAEVDHESEFDISMVVRNKAAPTMPHLLENSHKIIHKIGKGYIIVNNRAISTLREVGETKPHPHILANAESEIEAFYDEVKNGGGDS